MAERKINLDDYIDELPLSVASYRTKIKSILNDFAKDLLELAAENAFLDSNFQQGCCMTSDDYEVNKQSILDTINQIK